MQKYWNPETISCLNMQKDILKKVRQKLQHEEGICKDKIHNSLWSGIYKELYESIRKC